MRLRIPSRDPAIVRSGAGKTSARELSAIALARAPSQKELAGVLRVTTRHLRRWETAEAAAGRPCSRPYTASDLWRLLNYRHGKGWDREEASRLHLTALFDQFEKVNAPEVAAPTQQDDFSVSFLMLRSIAWDESPPGQQVPRMLAANLANSARDQLRAILGCERGRSILVRAFFEAALVSEQSPATPYPIRASA